MISLQEYTDAIEQHKKDNPELWRKHYNPSLNDYKTVDIDLEFPVEVIPVDWEVAHLIGRTDPLTLMENDHPNSSAGIYMGKGILRIAGNAPLITHHTAGKVKMADDWQKGEAWTLDENWTAGLQWTKDSPTEEGYYVTIWKHIRIRDEYDYWSENSLKETGDAVAWWYGPIPEPPEED